MRPCGWDGFFLVSPDSPADIARDATRRRAPLPLLPLLPLPLPPPHEPREGEKARRGRGRGGEGGGRGGHTPERGARDGRDLEEANKKLKAAHDELKGKFDGERRRVPDSVRSLRQLENYLGSGGGGTSDSVTAGRRRRRSGGGGGSGGSGGSSINDAYNDDFLTRSRMLDPTTVDVQPFGNFGGIAEFGEPTSSRRPNSAVDPATQRRRR